MGWLGCSVFFQQPVLNQSLQSGSQDIACDVEVLLNLVEAMCPEQDVAQH